MFDINKLENTRLFGSNKIFPIILYAVYLLILIRETFIIFKSKGIYMYIENNRLYCKNKFITLLSDIDTTKSYFITKYFAKFLHIDCILGSNVDITLVYAKLEDEDLLSKIIEL